MDLTEIKIFEQQQVGTLKLSAAIRIGAKIRPQCVEHLFRNGGSCAIGAAYEGRTGKTDAKSIGEAMAALPELDEIVPSGECLAQFIFVLNDRYDFSREEIADKVEALGY